MSAQHRTGDPRSGAQRASPVPTIERKERYRLFRDFRQAVIALSGVFPLIPIFLMDQLPRPLGYVLLGAVLVGVPALSALAYRYWPRRRQTLRVDETGVHEVLRKGRLNSLRWNEIDRLDTVAGQRTGWTVVPREPGRAPIYFDARLQDEVVQGLKRFEFALRRELQLGSERVFLSGSEEVPATFRELVEEYYRALSREPGGP